MENTVAKSGSREKEKCLVIFANEEGEEKTFEANGLDCGNRKAVSKSAHENNYQ